MHKIMTYALLLGFISIAVTSTAIVVGRLEPTPTQLEMLHLNDCAPPCWIGIVPGKTTIDEARARIRAVYGDSLDLKIDEASNIQALWFYPLTQPRRVVELHVMLAAKDHVVREIGFYFNPEPSLPTPFHMPNLAELYSILGEPTGVVWQPVINGGPGLFYGNKDDGVAIHIPNLYHLRLNVQPSLVTFYGSGGLNRGEMRQRFAPWRGFASYVEPTPTR